MHANSDWRPAQIAAVLDELQQDGYTRTRVATLAGIHRAQPGRWARGAAQPSYDSAMRVAGWLRVTRPDLVDDFIAAAGYGDGPVEPDPEPDVGPKTMAAIREEYPDPEDQQRILSLIRREGIPPRGGGGGTALPGPGQARSL